jgi:hypothetical protein
MLSACMTWYALQNQSQSVLSLPPSSSRGNLLGRTGHQVELAGWSIDGPLDALGSLLLFGLVFFPF